MIKRFSVFFTLLFVVLVFAAAPASAHGGKVFGIHHFFPKLLVFEAVNFGATNVILVGCRGRFVQTPQEFTAALIPVYGPVTALQSCSRR